ncbi:MAG: YraN family protein [Candidatus Sungbacteria bacterium]|nr:YraN family protein [Candidatus Sungbacteria bacterium]
MPSNSRKFGDIGEEASTAFLVKHGFKILDHNYKRPWGEIDIVAEKDGTIRFIEVKTSKYKLDSNFRPEIRVDWKKQRKLRRICETYLFDKKPPENQQWQIDVISVILDDDNSIRDIYSIENAVFEREY